MATQNYRPEEIVQIRMATRILLNDALGRYIHDPKNLDLIQSILRNGLLDMQGIAPNETKLGCPPGYSHVNCSCTVDLRRP